MPSSCAGARSSLTGSLRPGPAKELEVCLNGACKREDKSSSDTARELSMDRYSLMTKS
jgi:hypothetical protein